MLSMFCFTYTCEVFEVSESSFGFSCAVLSALAMIIIIVLVSVSLALSLYLPRSVCKPVADAIHSPFVHSVQLHAPTEYGRLRKKSHVSISLLVSQRFNSMNAREKTRIKEAYTRKMKIVQEIRLSAQGQTLSFALSLSRSGSISCNGCKICRKMTAESARYV